MIWCIPTAIDVQHRLKVKGKRPLFAWLDFRLLPSDSLELAVTTAWLDDADDRWLPAINAAIESFVVSRASIGSPVGFTTIEMTRVISHPIDTDNYAVRYNMTRALEIQFKKHAVKVESEPTGGGA